MIGVLIAKLWLKATGFKAEGDGQAHPKFVLIAAPHTSNWDLPHALAAATLLGIKVQWIGKHTLFRFPLGVLLRALGGVSIDRRARQNLVQQLVERFEKSEKFALIVPPEGTRGKVDYWKSGFYQIAKGAKVPIAMAYVDYGRKAAGIGGYILPSGDVRADMDRIRAFYKDVRGRYPEMESIPRLKEEDQKEASQ